MDTAGILDLESRYLMTTYGRPGPALVRGQGAYAWDADGKEYLDFIAGLGVLALGHCHPAVVEAVCRQAGRMMHCSNLFHIESQAVLARELAEATGVSRAFFCNSGAEANEAAIKLARKYGGGAPALRAGAPAGRRYRVISALNSFHGRTLATLAATGQTAHQAGFEPMPEGFDHVPFNDLAALEAAVGPETCAVLLEPVQGEGGINPADPDYLAGVRRLCDRLGLILIFDEVQCGLGRTGKLLAAEHYGVRPDIVTLSKALGGGFPIGAALAAEKVAATFQPCDHASTFGGNPVACEAALAVLGVLRDGLVEHAARLGAYFRRGLEELAGRRRQVVQVRGLGLMLAAELDRPGQDVVDACANRGLLINCTARRVLRFLPPLIVGEEEVDRALSVLDEVLA